MDLLVTIDTEEEGLWGGTYNVHGNTVENIRGVPRFQELCDRFDIRPTYLIDTPVVESDYAVKLFRDLQASDRCEVGAHLHPWCTMPFDEQINSRNSYMCNLPESLQREKLRTLTDAIAQRLGRRPTSFRAGRYGLDMNGVRILAELGYVVDSSVIPFRNYAAGGGPDFQRAPTVPYYLDGDNLCHPHDAGILLEVPVTVGFNRKNFQLAQQVCTFLSQSPFRAFRLRGILDRTGLIQMIKFSPEQSSGRQMARLVKIFLAKLAPCVVLMFHSSSLVPGLSPYVKNAEQLEDFYRSLVVLFDYCHQCEINGGVTLTEFAKRYDHAGQKLDTEYSHR